jgi:hypothetical protein
MNTYDLRVAQIQCCRQSDPCLLSEAVNLRAQFFADNHRSSPIDLLVKLVLFRLYWFVPDLRRENFKRCSSNPALWAK